VADTTMPADLGNVGVGRRDQAVETVTSIDGVQIAYERSGHGQPVVILGGGLNEKAMFVNLANLMAENFTVFNYDRRGRGHSGDGDPEQYSIDLEIEDLRAVMRAAGDEPNVFANCTGGMIAIPAAARGLPMAKLAVYEPPYAAPEVPAGFMDRLKALLSSGRRGDAVALFQKESVGFSDETIAHFRAHPVWPAFEALAPTLIYDCTIGTDYGDIPFDQLSQIAVPTLVLDGGDSPAWIRDACETLAREIPDGTHFRVPNEGHLFNQQSGAPLLTDFFRS
jgi:acyltransferase